MTLQDALARVIGMDRAEATTRELGNSDPCHAQRASNDRT